MGESVAIDRQTRMIILRSLQRPFLCIFVKVFVQGHPVSGSIYFYGKCF